MQALRFDRSGRPDGLALVEVPDPTAVAGEVVVRVRAAAVYAGDVAEAGDAVPRIPGRDFAGVVVDGPAELVGREVWGGGWELGRTRDGSHAEYLALPAAAAAAKPANLSFDEAAAVIAPYGTALAGLDRAGVRAGTRLVVLGQGPVGRAALALGRAYQAAVVVAVPDPEQAAALRGDGVESVTLDADLAAAVGARWDALAEVVFDTTGEWLAAAVPALAENGRVAVVAGAAAEPARLPLPELCLRGASIVGVDALRRDLIATGRTLGTLRAAFETGLLGKPDRIVRHRLADGVRGYRERSARGADTHVLTP